MSTLPAPLSITGLGGISAVGSTAAQTCASIRAGIMGFAEHLYEPVTRDPGWDEDVPLLAAPAPGIDPSLDGPARLLALAVPALTELAGSAGLRRRDLADAALLLSLPALDPVVASWDLARTFLPSLVKRAGLGSFKAAHVVQSGHTGVLELLGHAEALLRGRTVELCLVLGVDSYLAFDRLRYLDAGHRLKSLRAVDGMVPGEAAMALLVEAPARASARGVRVGGTVTALGYGEEPQTMASDKQSSGAGLTAALRAARLGSKSGHAQWVLCDLNGESYRSFEWGAAMARLDDVLGGVESLVHPAECLGDVGAATGGVLAAAALAAFERGYAPAPEALLWASSDGTLRAAARIERA